MTAASLANTIVCIPQIYFVSLFTCKFRKLKYDYSISFAITLSIQIIIYVLNTYWNASNGNLALKLVISLTGFFLTGFIIFEGSIGKKLRGILFVFAMIMIVDRICAYVFIYLGVVEIDSGMVTDSVIVVRNTFNSVMYACYILMEITYNRKRSREIVRMMMYSFLIAIAEISVLACMIHVTMEGVLDNLILFATIYSVVVFLGHQITMEFIQRNIEYQEKQNELEQKALERKYQYDYYLLAKQQGEEIRDVRHDMRNQLQTIQVLLQADGVEERQRAEQMLVKLRQKVKQPLSEDN